jgi:hypothetical protein
MRTRWLVAVGVALLGGAVSAQPAPPIPPPAVPALPPVPAPGQLPPFLPVPPSNTPLPEVPRPGPAIEYDHGYQYLPEQAPERVRYVNEGCGPPGQWWVAPSLELAWASTRPAPGSVRLRVPDPLGAGTLPGPVLPVAGRDAGRFEAAIGLVVGRWFGENNTHGVEASLFIRDANTTFDSFSPGGVVIVPRGRGRGARVVVFPDPFGMGAVGTFPATLGTFFATFDVNYRWNLLCTQSARLDALVGYRYAFLGDELYLGELADDGRDDFRHHRAPVSNSFNGGQIGLAGEARANGWYVAGSLKVAFGGVSSDVCATGVFVGAEGWTPGGFRRLAGLTGAERDTFAVMPVLNLQVGRQVTDHARIFAGYSFNYLSRVSRLGDALNPANGGLALTDFWVQSISFGGEFRF